MDPNATLDEIRAIIFDLTNGYKSDDGIERLIYLVGKLDRDLCEYGQIPTDWLKGQRIADGLED